MCIFTLMTLCQRCVVYLHCLCYTTKSWLCIVLITLQMWRVQMWLWWRCYCSCTYYQLWWSQWLISFVLYRINLIDIPCLWWSFFVDCLAIYNLFLSIKLRVQCANLCLSTHSFFHALHKDTTWHFLILLIYITNYISCVLLVVREEKKRKELIKKNEVTNTIYCINPWYKEYNFSRITRQKVNFRNSLFSINKGNNYFSQNC